jgi:serine phosphatase RsbU (regulator of sigma subunit)
MEDPKKTNCGAVSESPRDQDESTEPTPPPFEKDLPVLLAVDDDPDILRVVQFFLTKKEYMVLTAANGEEALAIIEKEKDIELILSDVMMPKINGLELLSHVRKHETYREVPFILISAEGETSKKVNGLNLGASDFITKPFNFDELMARVRQHIDSYRMKRELEVTNKQLEHAQRELQKQYDRLEEDLEAARGVQLALMPEQLPQNEHYSIGKCYMPASRMGGDFFDVVSLEEGRKLGVLVADVVGHGVAATFSTAMTKLSFQNACYSDSDPGVVLERMNRELSTIPNDYVTVFFGVFDQESHSFGYASGGHPPLILHRRSTGEVLELESQATFLGYFDPVEFSSDTIKLEKGDRILFYTDGLFESSPDEKEEFGRERVIQLINKHSEKPIQELIDILQSELTAFMNGKYFDDDVTMVGLDILT